MHGVNERRTTELGPKLAPFAEEIGGAAALSPVRSPATQVPVFLLHGADDNVIPSSESMELARYLSASGNTHVRGPAHAAADARGGEARRARRRSLAADQFLDATVEELRSGGLTAIAGSVNGDGTVLRTSCSK